MPDIRHLHKGDTLDLYLTVPVCKATINSESAVYKIVDYHGTSLRICSSTGLPKGRKDMVAMPLHYPREGLVELVKRLRTLRSSDLEILSDQELYQLESVINKLKA